MPRHSTAAPSTHYVKQGKGHGSYEHQRIAARVLGRPVPIGAQVHHHDGDGRNNARRNLVICQSQRYHQLLHARQRVLAAGGDPNADAWCPACQSVRPLRMFWFRKTGRSAGRPMGHCRYCVTERLRVTASLRRIRQEAERHAAR